MIVRPENGSLLLITQPDHAVLARRIMENWTRLERAERRASILHAIEQHDNGWLEPDAAPIVDPGSGRILDFVSAPAHVREGIWPRGVARLADDPWAAALVAQHAITIYDRYRTSPEWETFFEEMERARALHAGRARLDLDTLMDEYAFVRIGDLASLAFCNGWTDEQRYDDYSIRLSGSRLLITPDPFGGAEIPIDVPGRAVPDRSFGSDSEALAAFSAARLVRCTGVATGHA